MVEIRDSAIKLFGKTIQLLREEGFGDSNYQNCSNTIISKDNKNEKSSGGEAVETKPEDGSSHPVVEDSIAHATSCKIAEDPKTLDEDKEIESPKTTKNEDSNENSSSQEKTLKKLDKILPCPRCNSMDTKFCYYNNYNISQPRHFCKKCQRYWTDGGTMRNVPVGSGRRKNKSSIASHYSHVIVSEALQPARAETSNAIPYPAVKLNGTVLTSNAPLCESMASVLNLAEKSRNCVRNVIRGPKQTIPDTCGVGEHGSDHSGGSSTSASSSVDKGSNAVLQNFKGFPSQVPCFLGPPWASPWNSGQWRSPMPQPAFGPSGFPVSFYPVPNYWSCNLPSPWNMPWISPPPSADHSALSSSPNSPTLGKHSRNGDMLTPLNQGCKKFSQDSQGFVWALDTMKIDDPSEAAKSSIWSTLGTKNENTNSMNGGSLFKAFQPKGVEKNPIAENSLVLQANPAAWLRSINFHEST